MTAFAPPRWLRNCHLQTLLVALPRRGDVTPSERALVTVEQGTQVLLECHWHGAPGEGVTALLVHGLEGDARSPFIIGMTRVGLQLGMNVVRMNIRNCGGTEHLSRTLYHSGLSSDVGAVVDWLVGRGHRRIGIAGFSMGGNMVLKLAAERATSTALSAVAVVCPAADPAAAATALHRPSNRGYEAFFLAGLMRRYRRKVRAFPGRLPVTTRMPRSLREFDDVVTAPHFGFADVDDYYARAAAGPLLHAIRAPTLVLHAGDDPFVPMTGAVRAAMHANPAIRLVEPERGGHCGFYGADGFWAERTVMQFIALST